MPSLVSRVLNFWNRPMACTCPIDAWRPPDGAADRRLVFAPYKGSHGRHVRIDCGQCMDCLLRRAQDWAVRCVHEAQLHEQCWFVTFTYNDAHLPDDYSVGVRPLQLLHKAMRQKLGPFRFFGCGENGEKYGRPHFHVIYFGLALDDLRLVDRAPGGDLLYESPTLTALWGKGRVVIGYVTLKSAGYVARYSTKKMSEGPTGERHVYLHPLTGELVKVAPPFVVMSRRPGIGQGWLDKYGGDAFPSDFVIVEGRRLPVPGYYLRQLDKLDGREAQGIRIRRVVRGARKGRAEAAAFAASGYGQSRLLSRHQIGQLRAKRLVRSLEEESSNG